MHTKLIATFMLLLPFLVKADLNNGVLVYEDQKQNCTKINNYSYCYYGPKFDAIGQYKTCSVPGTFALTFDDGPVGAPTNKILDILKQYNMKATFFLIGQNILSDPVTTQRIISEGHQIGAHTYSHPFVSSITTDEFIADMNKFENTFMQRNFNDLPSFYIPSYFRSPHGELDIDKQAALNAMGYIPMHWSMLNQDSYTNDSSLILPMWYSHFSGINATDINMSMLSVIMQQHDREPATYNSFAEVAKWLNDTFVSRGVRFTTIADCLNNTLPMYRPSPRRYEDPTCSTGIIRVTDTATGCCTSSCGTCGGTGCGSRPGGSANCCLTSMLSTNVFCKYSAPPCLISVK